MSRKRLLPQVTLSQQDKDQVQMKKRDHLLSASLAWLLLPLLMAVIDWYQKHISPRKQYQCAHTQKGELSCSAHAKQVLQSESFNVAVSQILARRQACQYLAYEHGFSYRQAYMKSGVAVVTLMMVTGCCTGSECKDDTTEVEHTKPVEVPIKIAVAKEILPANDTGYTVIANGEAKALVSPVVEMAEKNDALDVVGVSNESGEPFLMAWKHPNTTNLTVDVESSAVVFFLRRPQLAGVTFTNTKAVEARVRAHEHFPKLVALLESEIKDSPCPLDPFCSTEAMVLSDEMYDSMNFDDLIQ
ncbi:membrane protein insertion efficiency factor YidD [Psychrobacter sp. I-STPA10]|uniref:membrane protein insertion efficiency factor YidD n=1 Tax=Psychrobacter sp. I-STPA10 TaxID=2585769 RepID=UPI001E3A26DA|nr:membrane protein insertion efficiency factor YidD [Psychrobacter sp. I-STPA10]